MADIIKLADKREEKKLQKLEKEIDEEYRKLLAQGWVICDPYWRK